MNVEIKPIIQVEKKKKKKKLVANLLSIEVNAGYKSSSNPEMEIPLNKLCFFF